MQSVGVPRETIAAAIAAMRRTAILPYRFIAAARYAPRLRARARIGAC